MIVRLVGPGYWYDRNVGWLSFLPLWSVGQARAEITTTFVRLTPQLRGEAPRQDRRRAGVSAASSAAEYR